MTDMTDLPPEVLQVMFSCLPLQTLLTTCTRVCSQWRDIISENKFLQWRKLYYRYKADSELTFQDVDDEEQPRPLELDHPALLLRDLKTKLGENTTVLSCDMDLLLCFSQDMYRTEKRSNIFSSITHHPDYSLAVETLTRAGSPTSPVSVTTWLTITSSDVWSVRNIVRILLSSHSEATTADITEYLYMLAALLLYYERVQNLPSRFHYIVFHALYFLENDWAVTPVKDSTPAAVSGKKNAGQQSLMAFGFNKTVPSKLPTAEQLRIIQHPFSKERKDLIKIVAFAGTGKTTTLVRLTENYPNLRFLLVVYNKSVRIQAEQLFPRANVVCKTVHQMAMAKCGFMFSKKMTSNLRAKDILDSGLLAARGEGEGGQFRRSGQVLSCLTSFLNSPDSEISLEHVPSVWTVGYSQDSLSALQRQLVLEDTRAVWRAMIDKEDMRVRMPHDGYLKVWQLRSPNLQWITNHDVLLLDEGQDMNPAMLDIFMKQSVTRVIVGDPHQQIYMFRGAVNALGLVTPTHTFFLTQSFRFGPEIGFVANKCLLNLKGLDSRTLVGGKKKDSFLGTNRSERDQVAFIGRTNFGLFEKLNKLMSEEAGGKRIGLVGGAENYNFDDYLDIFYLMMDQKQKMKKYKNWKSYQHFKSFAKNVADVELLSKIKIVESFGPKIVSIVEKVKTVCTKDIRKADIVLSTIHKAKGLEFDTVILLNDFDDQGQPGRGRSWPEDEKNLLYVAITRAKNNLVMNNLVRDEIIGKDGLHRLTILQEGDSPPASCGQDNCNVELGKNLHKPQMLCRREDYRLSSGVYHEGVGLGGLNSDILRPSKLYCSHCSGRAFPWFRKFFHDESDSKRGEKRKRNP